MNELKIIKEQEVLGKQFKIYGDFENPLFLAKDICNWIEHNNITHLTNMVDEDEKLIRTIHIDKQRRKAWFVTKQGFTQIIVKSQKIPLLEKKAILQSLGIEHHILFPRKETEFVVQLREVLNSINITLIPQYRIGAKIVDAYIEEYNLAIEFDEKYHLTPKQKLKDTQRENIIQQINNCHILRLSSDDTDLYNIGKVCKQLMIIGGMIK